MGRTSLRVIAAVVLAAWVFPVAVPLVCSAGRLAELAPCEGPAGPAHAGSTLAADSHSVPCTNPGLCAALVTAMPTTLRTVLAVAPIEVVTPFASPPLRTGDEPAPLPPPPLA